MKTGLFHVHYTDTKRNKVYECEILKEYSNHYKIKYTFKGIYTSIEVEVVKKQYVTDIEEIEEIEKTGWFKWFKNCKGKQAN